MAKAPAQPPASPVYAPETSYRVTLARPVAIGAARIKPAGEITMTGAIITQIIKTEGEDVILSATEIE